MGGAPANEGGGGVFVRWLVSMRFGSRAVVDVGGVAESGLV